MTATTNRADGAGQRCPVGTAIEVLRGRWKPAIVYYLRFQTRRFSELERLIPEAPRQVLAQQLRQLEANGIVSRTVYPAVPPKVEYSLTQVGRDLENILDLLETWGESLLSGRDHPRNALSHVGGAKKKDEFASSAGKGASS
jgi:DNA-binding HxlR family transcriptional regulator